MSKFLGVLGSATSEAISNSLLAQSQTVTSSSTAAQQAAGSAQLSTNSSGTLSLNPSYDGSSWTTYTPPYYWGGSKVHIGTPPEQLYWNKVENGYIITADSKQYVFNDIGVALDFVRDYYLNKGK